MDVSVLSSVIKKMFNCVLSVWLCVVLVSSLLLLPSLLLVVCVIVLWSVCICFAVFLCVHALMTRSADSVR